MYCLLVRLDQVALGDVQRLLGLTDGPRFVSLNFIIPCFHATIYSAWNLHPPADGI